MNKKQTEYVVTKEQFFKVLKKVARKTKPKK